MVGDKCYNCGQEAGTMADYCLAHCGKEIAHAGWVFDEKRFAVEGEDN